MARRLTLFSFNRGVHVKLKSLVATLLYPTFEALRCLLLAAVACMLRHVAGRPLCPRSGACFAPLCVLNCFVLVATRALPAPVDD